MLNSAAWVMLPTSVSAAHQDDFRRRGTMSGARRKAVARFVSGPMATSGDAALGFAAQDVDDGIDGMARRQRRCGLEKRDPVQLCQTCRGHASAVTAGRDSGVAFRRIDRRPTAQATSAR